MNLFKKCVRPSIGPSVGQSVTHELNLNKVDSGKQIFIICKMIQKRADPLNASDVLTCFISNFPRLALEIRSPRMEEKIALVPESSCDRATGGDAKVISITIQSP